MLAIGYRPPLVYWSCRYHQHHGGVVSTPPPLQLAYRLYIACSASMSDMEMTQKAQTPFVGNSESRKILGKITVFFQGNQTTVSDVHICKRFSLLTLHCFGVNFLFPHFGDVLCFPIQGKCRYCRLRHVVLGSYKLLCEAKCSQVYMCACSQVQPSELQCSQVNCSVAKCSQVQLSVAKCS